MKKLNVLTRMLLLVALLVGSVSAWGDTYVKVTSNAQLVDGATYILAGTGTSSTYIGTDFQDGAINTTTSGFTVNGNTITVSSASPLEVTLGVVASGYTLSYPTGEKTTTYIGYSGSSTSLETVDNNASNNKEKWTISTSAQTAAVKNVSTNTRFLGLSAKTGTTKIKAYSTNSGGTSTYPTVFLYKKQSNPKLTFSVSPSASGSVSVKNGLVDVSSGDAIAPSTSLNIVATPGDGKVFNNWTYTGTGASIGNAASASTTFTIGTGDATLTANFVDAAAYSITAQSNNNTYGTVSLVGTVITASPASGYRVSTSTPYTVTSGTAAVVQDGNVFTVDPSTDCTVTINFEEIPTYVVTIESPTGGTLVVKNGEEPIASGEAFAAGTVLTIEATPDGSHNFKNWQAIDASTHTYTVATTYTMTEHVVTIRANFDAKVYHTASFSVNGEVSSDNVEEGTAITFPDNPSNIAGKVFVGWSESPIANTTDIKPSFVASANMGNSDITYYAVFAKKTEDLATATLTTSEITSNFTNTSLAYATPKTYTDTGDNITWKVGAYADATSRKWFQLKKDAGSYLKITASDNIMSVSLQISNTDNESGGINDISKHGNFNGTVYLSEAAASSPSGDCGSTTVNAKSATINATQDVTEAYVQISVGARIWGVEVVHGTITYSEYCTALTTNITINKACTDGDGAYYGTFYTNRAYVMHDDLVGQVVSVDGEGKLVVDDAYTGGDVVPANTGLLIYTISDENYETTAFPVNFTTEDGADFSEFNFLKGTMTADEMTEGTDCKFYRLTMHNGTELGFWWGAEDGGAFKPGANKAYLVVPNDLAAKMGGFVIGNDDQEETTNIDSAIVEVSENASLYNLNGQKVERNYKGLVIINGKKVIRK